MNFEEFDTVEIFGRRRAQGPPYNGMLGFIDEVYGGGMYSFTALSDENGSIHAGKNRIIGVGACHESNMRHCDNEYLVNAKNSILYEREARYNEMMAKYHLKKIIENKDE